MPTKLLLTVIYFGKQYVLVIIIKKAIISKNKVILTLAQ